MKMTTELLLPEDGELYDYLEKEVRLWNKIYRRVHQDMTTGVFDQFKSISQYTSHIHQTYNVLTRTANSIVRSAKARMKALKELKKTQIQELNETITHEAIFNANLWNDISSLKEGARNQELSQKELRDLRNKKDQYKKKDERLDALDKKRNAWVKEVATDRVKMTHGSKKLFSQQYHLDQTAFNNRTEWEEAFDWALNHNMFFIGRKEETHGNQLVQLIAEEDGSLTLSLRKDYPFCQSKKEERIIVKGLKLKYQKERLSYLLSLTNEDKDKRSITCRFLKKKNQKWYLQIIFETDKIPLVTSRENGVIAIDFNDGFLALASVKRDGNLTETRRIELKFHGGGGKALAEMRDVASQLAKEAARRGMPIAIEVLSFGKAKAQTKKGHGSKYNKMLHTLDYSRFNEAIDRACERNGVELIPVDAAYTSQIGQKKYGKSKRLDRHFAAAYVIGRRALGFRDSLKK